MDIALFNEDLNVVQTEHTEAGDAYDLVLQSADVARTLLVRRAVETPEHYLSRFVLTEEGLTLSDHEFGDPLYTKLSEPLSINLVTEAGRDIRQALSHLDETITVDSVGVGLTDLDALKVQVNYSVDNQQATMEVPIQ